MARREDGRGRGGERGGVDARGSCVVNMQTEVRHSEKNAHEGVAGSSVQCQVVE